MPQYAFIALNSPDVSRVRFIQVSKDLENIPFTRVAYGEVKRCRLLKELKIIPINFFILFLAQFVTNALIYLVQ